MEEENEEHTQEQLSGEEIQARKRQLESVLKKKKGGEEESGDVFRKKEVKKLPVAMILQRNFEEAGEVIEKKVKGE